MPVISIPGDYRHDKVRKKVNLPAFRRLSGAPSFVLALAMAALVFAIAACGGESSAIYPILLTDSLVADGQVVYEANCAACHGDSTTPPPLPGAPTHSALGHTWHHQDRMLVEWVLDGVPLAQVMPTFRSVLSEDEARSAIAYIKTFWPDEIIEMQTEGSAQYERQLAEQ